jgi:hypothetical protein
MKTGGVVMWLRLPKDLKPKEREETIVSRSKNKNN